MNNMLETKCSFIITVQCPEKCAHEFKLPSDTFLHSDMVQVQCPECKVNFYAKNINGGINENN